MASLQHSPAGPAIICEDTSTHGLLARRGGPCPSGSKPIRVAGVNIFDSLWVGSSGMSTCCNPHGGPAKYPDALAALESAASSGVRVFRFFGSLFGSNAAFWMTNATRYWAEYDRLLDDIERLGLHAIPSIGTGQWHLVANAVTPGLNETANDCIRNRTSVAFGLQSRYFTELVGRYAARKGVLAWELGNELNLMVNLPSPWCGPQQCFSTAELVMYTQASPGERVD